jgi:hypothetical protein
MLPTTRTRKREKRCYELSYKTLQDLPPDSGWQLVHGMIEVRGQLAGHAWIESDERELAFDAVRNETFSCQDYYERARATPVIRYHLREAAQWMSRENSWGPWVERVSQTLHAPPKRNNAVTPDRGSTAPLQARRYARR